jgi:hypothetical protein
MYISLVAIEHLATSSVACRLFYDGRNRTTPSVVQCLSCGYHGNPVWSEKAERALQGM